MIVRNGLWLSALATPSLREGWDGIPFLNLAMTCWTKRLLQLLRSIPTLGFAMTVIMNNDSQEWALAKCVGNSFP